MAMVAITCGFFPNVELFGVVFVTLLSGYRLLFFCLL
jgi:hypothetical protein